MKDFVLALIDEHFPALTGGLLIPIRSRVVRVAGDYADLQLLRPDGSDNLEYPVIPLVTIPAGMTLNTGDTVRVGHYYGDRHQPFIQGMA
jgi:hypothetical protein